MLDIPTLDEIGGLNAANDIELHDQIRTVLRMLRPHDAPGFEKVRLGRAHDGGYIQLDDFDGVDVGLSLGINDDISWDLDAVARGLTVYQFDHTVEDPAPNDSRMVFAKKMISADQGPDRATLEELIAEHDKRAPRPNMMLKMDIEGGEWPALEATSDEALGRFSQIVCELHDFEKFERAEWRQGFYRAIRKLARSYACVHVHANNFAGYRIIAGVPVAPVIEVTFANRAIYALEDSHEMFPTAMDMPCHSLSPDVYLGAFRY